MQGNPCKGNLYMPFVIPLKRPSGHCRDRNPYVLAYQLRVSDVPLQVKFLPLLLLHFLKMIKIPRDSF